MYRVCCKSVLQCNAKEMHKLDYISTKSEARNLNQYNVEICAKRTGKSDGATLVKI